MDTQVELVDDLDIGENQKEITAHQLAELVVGSWVHTQTCTKLPKTEGPSLDTVESPLKALTEKIRQSAAQQQESYFRGGHQVSDRIRLRLVTNASNRYTYVVNSVRKQRLIRLLMDPCAECDAGEVALAEDLWRLYREKGLVNPPLEEPHQIVKADAAIADVPLEAPLKEAMPVVRHGEHLVADFNSLKRQATEQALWLSM
ncbi:MAG: hypothetical protein KVP17_004984 [Porospora cf. gigantea B]|uniref:uncharacterized protein n=1 Tax=Porospora cf. gigantea B TaxID=2853592 RepID=UPI003571F4BB|nr:MAG: hypothetical protein KVP17_004984 [Porospora cf. gigantea B]